MKKSFLIAALLGIGLIGATSRAASAQTLGPQERMCDPTFEDCRADILTYIQQETVEIDMGFWMITDARYANALVAAWQRGVKIRLLMDPRCTSEHQACETQNTQLANAGIPMRNRATSGILHWKMVIFAGQGQMEFAGANYAPFEMVPDTPWVNYTDEIVYYTNDPSLLHSFMTRFDDLWTSPTEFANFANVTGPLTRSFPTYPIDAQLNFPPDDSYRTRTLNAYAQEQQAIDAFMFRITDEQQSDGIIAQVQRGIPVRLITDEGEYRNTDRLWDAYNVDKMYQAGVQVRLEDHQGINHAKGILLYSQGMSIFGSSNWTSPSSDSQREHNMFTTQPWIFTWLQQLFNRKWTNGHGTPETKAFVPLAPDAPVYNLPASAATNVPTTGTSLSWNAGLWAHIYDIYFGTTPNPPLLTSNVKLGPSQYSTDYRTYALPALQPGTTYYWKIVSKTMAYVTAPGPVWSFQTAGTATSNNPPSVSITAPANNASFVAPATVTVAATAADSDGTIARVDFYQGSTLIGSATTAPYSVTWSNVPAGSYSLTAVATDNGNAFTSSAAVTITVATGASTLPSGWTDGDIGSTGAVGTASFSSGTFSVTGAGADVWGGADALNYVSRSLTGDGTIVARVASIQAVNAWTKAGVMIRNSTSPSSAQAFMLVASSAAKGAPFQRRTADGNMTSVSTTGPLVTAPYWVKLVRAGALITASVSADGAAWTQVGSDTFSLNATIRVGLGVSSHVAGSNATATFDNVTVTPASGVPPTVALTAPANGATYVAPATITLTASASDSDGTVAAVQFYAGSTLLGTSTSAPYSFTWSNVAAGSYTLTAVATDNDGLTAGSAPVNVTVSPGANNPPVTAITSPANNAAFTAPATIAITASASDSDGSIASVAFYNGSTLLGTTTKSPYSFNWANVAAGTYSLTTVATDNSGATTSSSAVTVTVANTALPNGWAQMDIGAPPVQGSGSYSNGVFTATGSGADIWGTADQFHYVYTQMSGNRSIVARVTGIQNVAVWVKAAVMIRQTLDASSAQAMMLVSSQKGTAFQRRTATGGASTNTTGSTAAAPRWVKLTRSGNTITAYESADGAAWTLVGSDTFSMPPNVYVGLAVTSHTTTSSATCTFDNVSIQ
ncbi:MAG TPA: Ig-like domain-containing protein [Vicinamibacterales bacterium]